MFIIFVSRQITFSINSDVFEIDAATGDISTAKSLDREVTDQYVVTVTATDDGDSPLETNVSVTIDVLDVNDNSPVFPATPTSFSISETLSMGAHVATISASDADKERTDSSEISFNITGGSGVEYFNLDPLSGNLTVAASLDYEMNTSFELIIEAYDGGNPTLRSNKTFTIRIKNADDNDPQFVRDRYTFFINENNRINDFIGRVEAKDLDPHNRSISYSFTKLQHDFTIDPTTGNISAAVVFDLEAPGGDGIYTIEVYTFYDDEFSDATDTVEVMITINDVDEFPFQLESIKDIEIFENGNVSNTVRVVNATDQDAKSSLSYAISITEDVLAINTTGGIYVTTEIDRESSVLFPNGGSTCPTGTADDVSCIRFNVRITDNVSGRTVRRGVYLLVKDLDDEPPVFDKSTYYYANLSESAEVGFQLGSLSLSASDPDIGVSLTYSIASNQGIDDFAIERLVALIDVAEELDYERSSSYNVTITATDTADNVGTTRVVIDIFDENDNTPEFVSAIYTATISENSEPGLEVTTVNATDRDSTSNAELMYRITEGNVGTKFDIDPDSGVVTLEASINREEVSFYSLTIVAVDGGTVALTGSVLLNISISDIDDHPPFFVESQFNGSVIETAGVGDNVLDSNGNPLQLSVEDLDEGSEVTISTYGFGLPFTVDETTGNVTVSGPLDAEAQNMYQFIAIAQDNTNLFSQPATVIITVTGTNDHTPAFEQESYEITIEENSSEGEVILEVIAEDLDLDDTVVYSIETNFNGSEIEIPDLASGDISSGEDDLGMISFPFELNNSTGEITLLRTLDYETVQWWMFTVTATDEEGLSDSVNVTISVEDLNDNTPRFNEHVFEIDIREDAVVSDTVPVSEVIRAQDSDSVSEDNLRYYITSGAQGTFEMNRETGDLYLIAELNPTLVRSYELEVVVSDGEKEDTANAVITVVDINNNSPVFEEDSYMFFLLENATNGTLVDQVVATDNDLLALGRITYSLSDGDTDIFYIDNSTGEIFTIADSFDSDSAPYSYELIVIAMDGGMNPRSASTSVEINLVDVNDNDPVFSSDPFIFEVAEDADIDASVFRVTAMDIDAELNAELEFEILTENSSFSIDLESGIVRIAGELDFDNTSLPNPVVIEIAATDRGNPPRTTNGTLNITITDTNDNAPYFSGDLIQAFVAENTTVNATAFTVKAFDRDSNENAELTYEILSAIPVECNRRYRIVATTGEVILNEPVDAEEREESCTLLVRATDNGDPQLSTTATFNVLITNINENPPEFIPAQPAGEVAENSKNGTSVLTLQTEDADGDNVRYVAVAGDNAFDVSSDGVITVAKGAMLNREVRDTYELLVEAHDDGTPRKSSSATVKITLTDKNDNPPLFDEQDYFVSVRESLGLNEAFATLLANDADIGSNDDIEYLLVENGEGATDFDKFAIASETGQLFLTASLDFETEDHYYLLRVAARDGVFQSNTSVHIRVLESNDITPMFDNLPSSTDLAEDAQNGTIVFNVSATDDDLNVNGRITYSLMESDGSEKFSIDADTGVIIVDGNDQFDFDDGAQIYELTVVAMDNAGAMPSGDNEAASGSAFGNEPLLYPDDEVRTNTSTLTVQITDVNDNAPVFTESSYNPVVVEHDGISLTIIRVSATDADEPDTPNSHVNYDILSGSFGRFEIDDSGNIVSVPPIDREVVVVYYLLVVAYDHGNPSLNTTINMTVTVHDSDDERPVFTQTRYTGSIEENSPKGVSVLKVRAVDRDTIESPANYSLQVSDISEHFMINTTGVVETSDLLIDRETNQNFTLVAQAGDISSIFSTAEVFVTVLDLNDERPVFEETEYSFNVSENQAINTRLRGVRAVDRDSGVNAVTVYDLVVNSGRSGLFEIDSETADIVVEMLPCFSESSTETHTFTLHATDNLDSSLNDTAFLSISLYEENNYPPVFVQPSYVSRLDSLAPAETEVISRLRTTDKDVCSGAPIFEIVDGNANDTFEIDNGTGRIILTRNLTEDDLSFTLSVRATDTGNFNVGNRSSTVSIIVLIGQLLPVSVTVDPGLTTLLISRLSQFEYVQDIWLHDSGGSVVNSAPNLTYTLGTVSEEAQVPVVGVEASSITAALARTDVYPDEPVVLVGVQVEGPNFGRASVKATEVYILLETDTENTTASCVTIQGTGSCVVSASVPSGWFTASSNVSVYYGLSTEANEFLGSVTLNSPESCETLSSPTVRVELPAKVIFPGSVFDADVYAGVGADINYFVFTFSMSEGLEFVKMNWYPSSYSIQYATFNNMLSVTATNTEYSEGINSDVVRILSLQFRLKSDASISNSDIYNLDCTVEYLVTGNGEEVLTNESAVHVSFDEDGSCNSPMGKILVASPTLVKLLPYTTTTGLLNTAHLNSNEVTVDIIPYGFMSSGEFSSSLTNLTCESDDESILKVDPDCSYVYLLGNETSGADRVDIRVIGTQFFASLSFQVWFPGDIDITFGVTDLSPVQGVMTSDCSDAYESTSVTVQAAFTSGDQRQVATITPLVASLLSSTDEEVLVLEVDSTSKAVRAVGRGSGEASVTFEVYDGTITSESVDVMGLSVRVDDISFSLHTGISPSPLPSATAGESYLDTAKVTLLSNPQYLNQPISVLAEAVLSNGRNLRLSNNNGLILNSTNHDVIIVSSFQEVTVRGGGSGLYLMGYLEIDDCPLSVIELETQPNLVEVDFQPIREINTIVDTSTLATPSHATLLGLPTSTSVSAYLVHEDGTSVAITEDERTSFESSSDQITISSNGTAVATNTPGLTNITVKYEYNSMEYTAVKSVEVIGITSIQVSASPYPSYSRSDSVDVTTINRYPVINETVYQKILLQVTALLSDGTLKDISESGSVSFSISNTSVLEQNGTTVQGLAPGGATVVAELGSLEAEISFNITDTELNITAITEFSLNLDDDNVLLAMSGSEVVPSLTLEFSDGSLYPSFITSSGPALDGLVSFSSSDSDGLPIDPETGLLDITGNRIYSSAQRLTAQLVSWPTITSQIEISRVDLEADYGEVDIVGIDSPPLAEETVEVEIYVNAEEASLGAVELELRFNESCLDLLGVEAGAGIPKGSLWESFSGSAYGQTNIAFITNDNVVGTDRMHVATARFRVVDNKDVELSVYVNILNEYSPVLATIGDPVPRKSEPASLNSDSGEFVQRVRCSSPPCTASECGDLGLESILGDVNADCVFDLLDVLALQVYSAKAIIDPGSFTASQLEAMDADKNGRIDLEDAEFLLGASLGRYPLIADLVLRPIDAEFSNCVLSINVTIDATLSDDLFVFFGLFHTEASFGDEYDATNFSVGTKLLNSVPPGSYGGWSQPMSFGGGVYGIMTEPGDIAQTDISFVVIYGVLGLNGTPQSERTMFLTGPPTTPFMHATFSTNFNILPGETVTLSSDNGFNGLIFDNSFTADDCYNNNAPILTSGGLATVQYIESIPLNTTILTVSATDADSPRPTGNVAFSLRDVTQPGTLAIDPLTGAITTASTLDRESYDEIRATVVVTDQGPHIFTRMTDTLELIVRVEDVNDNPPLSDQLLYSGTVSEAASGIVFQFTGSDEDSDARNRGISDITVSYNGSDLENIFEVNAVPSVSENTFIARLVLVGILDFENQVFYNLTLVFYDNGEPTLSSEAYIELNVTDANDNRPVFTSPESIVILENNDVGVPVIELKAEDADTGTNADFTFQINQVSEANDAGVMIQGSTLTGYFTLQSDDGAEQTTLRANRTFDREGIHSFIVVISAKEEGITSGTPVQFLWVMVCEQNDNTPTFADTVTGSVEENSIEGTVVTTLMAPDLDDGDFCARDTDNTNDNVVEYRLVSSGVPFMVDRVTGNVSVNGSLDYEREQTYVLEVMAYDLGSPSRSSTANLTISIVDLNDNSPILNQDLYVEGAFENSAVDYVVTDSISASDRDSGDNAVIKFSLTGNGSSDFFINPDSGVVTVAMSLDREARQEFYYLTVVAYNPNDPSQNDTAQLNITVFDINDNKPIFDQAEYFEAVSENEPFGTSILTVLATDADLQSRKITYRLRNNPPFFEINPDTGVIYVNESLCVPDDTPYSFVVVAEDRPVEIVLFTNSTNVTILVSDENLNAPQFERQEYGGIVADEVTPGKAILTVSATDSDICSPPFKYFIATQPPDQPFRINENTGVLYTNATLRAEERDFYTLTISVVDSGTPSPLTSSATVYVVVGETVPVDINVAGGFPVSSPRAAMDTFTYEQNYDFFYDTYIGNHNLFSASFSDFSSTELFQATPLPATKLVVTIMTPTVYYDNRTVMAAIQAQDEFNSYTLEDTEVYIRVENGASSVNTTGVTTLNRGSTVLLSLILPDSWFATDSESEATVEFGIVGQAPYISDTVSLIQEPNYEQNCSNFSSDKALLFLRVPAYPLYKGQVFKLPIFAKLDVSVELILTAASFRCVLDPGLRFLLSPFSPEAESFAANFKFENQTSRESIVFTLTRVEFPTASSEIEKLDHLLVEVTDSTLSQVGVTCTKYEALSHQTNSDPFSDLLVVDRWGCNDNHRGEVTVSRDTLAAVFPSLQQTVILNDAPLTNTRRDLDPLLYAYVLSSTPYPTIIQQQVEIFCYSSHPEALRAESNGGRCRVYVDGSETEGAESATVTYLVGELAEDFDDFEIPSSLFPVSLSVHVWYPDLPLSLWVEDNSLNAMQGWRRSDGITCLQAYQTSALEATATFRLGNTSSTVSARVEHLLSVQSSDENVIVLTGLSVVGQAPGEANITAISSDGRVLGSAAVLVDGAEVRPVEIELFHGAGVETILPNSIPYENSPPFQVRLDPGLQYEMQTAHLLTSVLFSDGTRYWVSDLVQYSQSTNSTILILEGAEVTALQSGTEELQVDWSGCNSSIISHPVPLTITLLEPEIRISIDEIELALPTDAASSLDEFPTSTYLRIELVYSEDVTIDITDNSLTSLEFYPENAVNYTLRDGKYLIEPLLSNTTVSVWASYRTYAPGQATLSVVKALELTLSAYHYPSYTSSSTTKITLHIVGNTGSFQKAKLEASLLVSIPGDSVRSYDISTAAETSYDIIGPSVRITGDVFTPTSVGDRRVVAEFSSVQSNELMVNVVSEDITVTSIDRLELTTGDTLSGMRNTVVAQLSISVTFSDGSKIEEAYVDGAQVIPALFTVVFADRDVARITLLTGDIILLDNAPSSSSLTVTVNDRVGLQHTLEFYANLEAAVNEIDLGSSLQAPVSPVSPGEKFSVPVYINTGPTYVGALELAVVYSSSLMSLESVESGSDWTWDPLINYNYFYASDNEFEGFVHLGGLIVDQLSGLIHIATLNFTAGDTSGLANIKAGFITYMDYSVPPVPISYSTTSPAANIGVLIGTPSELNQPDLDITFEILESSVVPCPEPLSCGCEGGKETGDINGDCVFNLLDVVSLYHNPSLYFHVNHNQEWAEGLQSSQCHSDINVDFNIDGVCDTHDVVFLLRASFWQAHFVPRLSIIPVNRNDCFLTIEADLVSRGDRPASAEHTSLLLGLVDRSSAADNQYAETTGYLGLGSKIATDPTQPGSIPGSLNGGMFLAAASESVDGRYEVELITDLVSAELGLIMIQVHRGYDRQLTLNGVVHMRSSIEFPPTFPEAVSAIIYHPWIEIPLTWDVAEPLRKINQTVSSSVCINDNKPQFFPRTAVAYVFENSTIGVLVATVFANDSDAEQNAIIRYSINRIIPNDAEFYINETSGEVFLNSSLDRERTDRYDISVHAEDQGNFNSLGSDGELVINVLDVNDNNPTFAQSVYYAPPTLENAGIGSFVITVTATDLDKDNNIEYSLPDPQSFSINSSTGAITVNMPLDYETVIKHELLVVATDEGGREGNTTVVIEVVPVNDNLPMCPEPMQVIVLEDDSVGTVFHTISVDDFDSGSIHRDLTFELFSNGSEFALNKTGDTTADICITTDELTFDGMSVYPLTIVTWDVDGNNCTAYVTVVVGEASTFDFQISGAGFAIGIPTKTSDSSGFEQRIGMFGNSLSNGTVTISLSGVEVSTTYYRNTQPIASLSGILLTPNLNYDLPYIRVAGQAKDATLNIIAEAELYIVARPTVNPSVDPVIGKACETESESGTCVAKVEVPPVWFEDYADSTLQIALVGGGVEIEAGQVALNSRPTWAFNSLVVQFPSYDLFPGQSFPIKVGAPLGNDIIAFEVSILLEPIVIVIPLSVAAWQCLYVGLSTTEFHYSCLRSQRPNNDTEDVLFPGEKFFEIHATVSSSFTPNGDELIVEATIHTVVSSYGPDISSDTPATVIDRRGVGTSPASLYIRSESTLGYLPYVTQAEVILVHNLSIDAYALKVYENSYEIVDLSSTEFMCDYESYVSTSCANVLAQFSAITTNGSEETRIIFDDITNSINFTLPLRIWYPSSIWYEVSDSTLNRVTGWRSADCTDDLYQQTKFRVLAEYTTGERTSATLDVTRFNLATSYDASVIRIDAGTVHGVSLGTSSITVWATPSVSYSGPGVDVVDDVISPLASYPVVFTSLYVTLSQQTYDRSSTIIATASGGQTFDAIGVEGQAATTVYFTDGSRYDPPAAALNVQSLDEAVATTDDDGVVIAAGSGTTSVSVAWLPQACSVQEALISTPAPVSVTLPYPVTLVVSSLTILGVSRGINISTVPVTAEFELYLIYSNETEVYLQDKENVQYSSPPSLSVVYNTVTNSITVSANDSSVESANVVFWYGSLTTTVTVNIIEVERLQAGLLPFPNNANIQVGLLHLDLEQVGSTSHWQRAELVVEAIFSDGTTERIENPSVTNVGIDLESHVRLADNRLVNPISGSFGTNNITARSGQLQSNTVTVSILDRAVTVDSIGLSITEIDRTEYQYSASVYFEDGTQINDVTTFSTDIGEELLTFQLVPEEVGSIDVSTGTITISQNHYDLVEFVASIGSVSATVTLAANLEPQVGQLDLGAADGVPIPPIAIDDTFSCDIRVNTDGNPIEALDVVLTYDATALELVSLYPLLGFSTVRSNNPIGEVQLTIISVEDNRESIQNVARVSFKAIAEGIVRVDGHLYILLTSVNYPQATASTTVRVGSSTALYDSPDPTPRELYLPPTSPNLDYFADGEVNIIDALQSVISLPGDLQDSNWDGLFNIWDVVYLSRATTGLAPILLNLPIIAEPFRPRCLLTFQQSFFSFADLRLYAVISHPNITMELSVSQAVSGSLISLESTDSGVFTTLETGSSTENGQKEFTLELNTPIDIRDSPVGYSLVAVTLDENGDTSPERTVQFIGGTISSFVGENELIPRLMIPQITIGEENGFRPLKMFIVSGLRSDYCSFNGSTIPAAITESAAIGSVIYIVSAVNSELEFPSSSEDYFITDESNPGVFSLEPNGSLILNSPLDFETQQTYNLTVEGRTAYSDGTAVYSAVIKITVLDANDEAPTLTVTIIQDSLFEDVVAGVVVAMVEASDSEDGPNGEFYFELDSSTDPMGQFVLEEFGDTANLSVNGELDREIVETYNLTILAIDRGIPPLSSRVSVFIAVQDINDNPPMFSQASYTISVPEETLQWNYTLEVEDPDAGENSEVTLSLDEPLFTITNDGVLGLLSPLDHENTSRYELTVLAVDGGGDPMSSSATVTIAVVDINDNSPELTLVDTEQPVLVEEDELQGTVIAKFSAPDRDEGRNGQVSFAIKEGDIPFDINSDTGTITLQGALDVNMQSEYLLTVVAEDSGEVPRNDTFSLTVFAIEGQVVSFDASKEGFLIGEYARRSERQYSQKVGYLVGRDIGSPVRMKGDINSETVAEDVVHIPNIGATPEYVRGALLQSELLFSQRSVVAFVQAFDSRDVIAEPTAIRVRVISNTSTPALEGSCTTSPDLGYCIASLAVPDSWFISPANVTVYANFLTIQGNGVEIGNASVRISPAYNKDFSVNRVLLIPPAHGIFPSRVFSADVYVVSPIEYETYNRIEFDIQSTGAVLTSESSDDTWQCSESTSHP